MSLATRRVSCFAPVTRALENRRSHTLVTRKSVAVSSDQELKQASDFFVDNFWVPQVAEAGVELNPTQRSGLLNTQLSDFEGRYGDLMGKRRLSSTLFVADGGLCGVELALVSRENEAVIPRATGESMLTQAISRFGPKERRLLKYVALEDLVADLLPGDLSVVPVLANLAVDATRRRGGVGKALCLDVEAQCREWGYDQVWLQVEEGNTPARSLYENKLGYEQMWTDIGGSSLRINLDDDSGAFKPIGCPIITLSKQL